MDLQQLDIKNRCLMRLREARYHHVEDVVLMSDEMLLEVFSRDEKLLLDLKECTYCYFCPYSYFRNRTCCDNVLHRGRFLSNSGILYREKMPGTYPVKKKNHLTDSAGNASKQNLSVAIHAEKKNISLPLKKEEIRFLSSSALFRLCCSLLEKGTLTHQHSAYAVVNLLIELQNRLPKKEFSRILAVSKGHLSELITQPKIEGDV